MLFAEASDREIKKLVDYSAQTNTKKYSKYAGTIYERSSLRSSRTRRQRQRHTFCIFNELKQTFARPSRAFIISVHFFPVLDKSAT